MPVEFEENKFAPRNFGGSATPKLAAWLMKKGLAKNEEGANKLQIIAAVVFFALSLFFFLS
ncbi:MAG: hypothetical protein HZA81_00900 [Candidatus Taylorbacteria bacterium]|nr:hypothetical protein [Candidatus Taylorbacteria bacterium]